MFRFIFKFIEFAMGLISKGKQCPLYMNYLNVRNWSKAIARDFSRFLTPKIALNRTGYVFPMCNDFRLFISMAIKTRAVLIAIKYNGRTVGTPLSVNVVTKALSPVHTEELMYRIVTWVSTRSSPLYSPHKNF